MARRRSWWRGARSIWIRRDRRGSEWIWRFDFCINLTVLVRGLVRWRLSYIAFASSHPLCVIIPPSLTLIEQTRTDLRFPFYTSHQKQITPYDKLSSPILQHLIAYPTNPLHLKPLPNPPPHPHLNPLHTNLRPHIKIKRHLLRLLGVLLPGVEINHILNLLPTPIDCPIVAIERGVVPQQREDPCLRRQLRRVAGKGRKFWPAASELLLVPPGILRGGGLG